MYCIAVHPYQNCHPAKQKKETSSARYPVHISMTIRIPAHYQNANLFILKCL